MKNYVVGVLLTLSLTCSAQLSNYKSGDYISSYTISGTTYKKNDLIEFTDNNPEFLKGRKFRILSIQVKGFGKNKKAIAWIMTNKGAVGIELDGAVLYKQIV